MNVSIALMRTFVTVADSGNIREAGERLGRTPSAVSMALKQLEQELGGSLFEADRKNALSPLGRYVYGAAREELATFERTVASMRSFARNETGRLLLAAVPSVASHILPMVLRSFLEGSPAVEIDLSDMDSLSVQHAVENGLVDLGIGSLVRRDTATRFEPLIRDAFGVVCRSDDPLAGLDRPLAWGDLAGRRMIANLLCGVIDDPEFQALLDAATLTVRNTTSIMALVRSGIGYTILPRITVPEADSELVFRPLAEQRWHREVGVILRSGHAPSPVAAAFIEHLRMSAVSWRPA